MSDKLPSIDDFYEELPSVEEVIKEENLPSVDEFIEEEPPRPEEEIADALREEEIEPEDVQDLTEVVRLINDEEGIFLIFLKLSVMMNHFRNSLSTLNRLKRVFQRFLR